MLHVYRVIAAVELRQLLKGRVISAHKFSTQAYAKGREGVFVFPRLTSKAYKNAFFCPWWGEYVVTIKVPTSRVVAHGVGCYDGGDFPELLISHYGIEDVTQVIPRSQLNRDVFYRCGTGAYGEQDYPMYLNR